MVFWTDVLEIMHVFVEVRGSQRLGLVGSDSRRRQWAWQPGLAQWHCLKSK